MIFEIERVLDNFKKPTKLMGRTFRVLTILMMFFLKTATHHQNIQIKKTKNKEADGPLCFR
ncbi:MAG: hypothetical protein JWN56_1609 [Sphingobacteriales bacterium]|nr:hypothetical protein [Sphingobacteriales bacterium]